MLPISPFYYVFISTSRWLESFAIIINFHKIVKKRERSSLISLISPHHVLAHTDAEAMRGTPASSFK